MITDVEHIFMYLLAGIFFINYTVFVDINLKLLHVFIFNCNQNR